MKICYLCGTTLVEANGERSRLDHEEHIIPNAIGGQLKARGILCSLCGGYLGNSIDSPFVKMFQLITHRLDIKRDRQTSPSPLDAKLTLHGKEETIDVVLRNSKLIHRKPQYKIDHNKKLVLIFANAQVIKQYRVKVEQELRELLGADHKYVIEVISDIGSHPDFAGTISFPFTLDNEVFKTGLVKIAIEYAQANGVSYEHVSNLVDRPGRRINSSGAVIPYYPIHIAEKTFEDFRSALDIDYLSHNLVLFSQRQLCEEGEVKQLYCFIELFGTFQYFVILNDNYRGPDIEPIPYSQRLIRQPFIEQDYSSMSIKDLSISVDELNIDWGQVDGKSLDEVRMLIEQKHKSLNRYVFNYSDHVKMVVDGILMSAIISKEIDAIETIPELISHFYRNPDTDDFHITFFRSRIIRKGKPYSIIPEITNLYQEERKKFNDYTFFKFADLEIFVNENANH